ncbi:MAG: hypothetical protein AAFQ09_10675 [Pseudomonadota bacterium]
MMRTILIPATFVVLSSTPALACTSADVEARQGALITAVQALLATNPGKAQEIVAQMQKELEEAQAAGDADAPCEIMDRLTAEAQS